jgi:dynein heavy chain
LEEAIHTFEQAKAGITTKTYDYLDQHDIEFDADFDIFLEKTDKLKESIGTLIEENFASVWETPQGIRFLTRFEKVGELNPD